ncbi:hypothetical protein THAOC_29571, partial [Thalassiosira oceanica]
MFQKDGSSIPRGKKDAPLRKSDRRRLRDRTLAVLFKGPPPNADGKAEGHRPPPPAWADRASRLVDDALTSSRRLRLAGGESATLFLRAPSRGVPPGEQAQVLDASEGHGRVRDRRDSWRGVVLVSWRRTWSAESDSVGRPALRKGRVSLPSRVTVHPRIRSDAGDRTWERWKAMRVRSAPPDAYGALLRILSARGQPERAIERAIDVLEEVTASLVLPTHAETDSGRDGRDERRRLRGGVVDDAKEPEAGVDHVAPRATREAGRHNGRAGRGRAGRRVRGVADEVRGRRGRRVHGLGDLPRQPGTEDGPPSDVGGGTTSS